MSGLYITIRENGCVKVMKDLIIADKDIETRKQMADLLIDAGYSVTVTSSVVKVIANVLKRTAQVLLLGKELGKFSSAELVPLLKKCNRNLMIILVADDMPLPLLRKVRQQGIFYHTLRPVEQEGQEEIRQAVKCAIDKLARLPEEREAEGSERIIALTPELGLTMADGGCPVRKADKKTITATDQIEEISD